MNVLIIATLVSVFTSFLGIGLNLFEMYLHDYSLPALTSCILTFVPPLLLLIIEPCNFASVAAVIGGVLGGVEGFIIIACFVKIKVEEGLLTLSDKVVAGLLTFVLGIRIILSI